MRRIYFNKFVNKTNKTSIRLFSIENMKENIKNKLYNIKIFFKWIQFHVKKYGKEIIQEHTDTLPDPPGFVPPKRLPPKEYIQEVLIPGIKFLLKHKSNALPLLQEHYLTTRTPEIMNELRQKGHDFKKLESSYDLNFEKELELKKQRELQEEEEFEEFKMDKQKELLLEVQEKVKSRKKSQENEENGLDSSSSIPNYFRFGSEIFFNSLRQFIIGMRIPKILLNKFRL